MSAARSSVNLVQALNALSRFHSGHFVRQSTCLLSDRRLRRLSRMTPCVYVYSTNVRKFADEVQNENKAIKGFTEQPEVTWAKLDNTIVENKDHAFLNQTAVAETLETPAQGEDDSKKKESLWFGKNAWKLGLVLLGGWIIVSAGALVYIWGSPAIDPDGNVVRDEFSELSSFMAYFKRASREFNLYKQYIKDPSSEKLLPDPLQEPYFQPPYTLILEMTGVLLHPDWTYETGWRFKKRPWVDHFLQQIGPPLFEVVIYTSEHGFTAFPLLDNLDPNGYIMYRLFRDSTRYRDGHHVKDLSCLNRDLSHVIIVDWNPKSYSLQPRNAVPVQKWTGSDEDRSLIDLAQFLRTIAMSGVDDVRPVLDYYRQFDDPLEAFRENQRKLQEEQIKVQDDSDKKRSSSFISSLISKRRL